MRGLILYRFIFLVALLSIIYVVQRFWFVRAWRLVAAVGEPGWRYLLHGLLITAALVVLFTILDPMLGRFIPRQGLGNWVVATARAWLIASFLGYLVVASVGILELLSKPAVYAFPPAQRQSIDQSRRTFFRYAAYALGGIPFLATTYGFAAGRLRYQVQKVDVPITNLPKSLDGLRILQISDVHFGAFMPQADLRRAIETANELNADLAVLTGDFINDGNDPFEECIRELSRLRAPLGVWGCNGNHEIYAEAEDQAQELFHRYGMRLLRHRNEQLEWHGGRFNLIGVDYQRQRTISGEQRQMLHNVDTLVRRDMPNILLSHNPNSFYRAAELGIELSLAGHTHGGQIRVEILHRGWSPARFMTNFVAGLYKLPMGNGAGSAQKPAFLYVNRGLGTFGIPVRLGVPPEITLLTLRASG
ncbi:MAG: metallophosphoesterase [Acidobacteria bacterium]|nr:metallophosphoesterase [Acidobacteriota bacterium]